MTDSHIQALLRTWGHFRRNGWNPGNGWYTENHMNKSVKGEAPDIPPDVLLVDKYIATLYKTQRRALTLTNVYNLPYRQAGQKMRPPIGKDSYAKILSEAEQRVAGYMSAIESREIA